MLLTDRIEIHQLQPLVWPSNLLYIMLSGCDWWILIRSVNNTQDWWKFWKRFCWCFFFQSRVSTKTVVRIIYTFKHRSSNNEFMPKLSIRQIIVHYLILLLVIKDYECVQRRNFNTDTLNDLRVWLKCFMPFWLKRSQYKLHCVTAPVSGDLQVIID